jgi:hypothetical protein
LNSSSPWKSSRPGSNEECSAPIGPPEFRCQRCPSPCLRGFGWHAGGLLQPEAKGSKIATATKVGNMTTGLVMKGVVVPEAMSRTARVPVNDVGVQADGSAADRQRGAERLRRAQPHRQ